MKKKRHDEAYIRDIEKAANAIVSFVAGQSQATFEKDNLRLSAVLYQLAIIGEASKHLSKEFREKHAGVPWRLMAGMRDVLVHAYHEMEFETVWKTATVDIPKLLVKMEEIAKSH